MHFKLFFGLCVNTLIAFDSRQSPRFYSPSPYGGEKSRDDFLPSKKTVKLQAIVNVEDDMAVLSGGTRLQNFGKPSILETNFVKEVLKRKYYLPFNTLSHLRHNLLSDILKDILTIKLNCDILEFELSDEEITALCTSK
jgi:hypothetical protein